MEYIIRFIIRLTKKLYFKDVNISVVDLYLHGGCYELVKIIKVLVPDTTIWINEKKDHCVIEYDDILYDANGLITQKIDDYHCANDDEIDYMEQSFGTNISL